MCAPRGKQCGSHVERPVARRANGRVYRPLSRSRVSARRVSTCSLSLTLSRSVRAAMASLALWQLRATTMSRVALACAIVIHATVRRSSRASVFCGRLCSTHGDAHNGLSTDFPRRCVARASLRRHHRVSRYHVALSEQRVLVPRRRTSRASGSLVATTWLLRTLSARASKFSGLVLLSCTRQRTPRAERLSEISFSMLSKSSQYNFWTLNYHEKFGIINEAKLIGRLK